MADRAPVVVIGAGAIGSFLAARLVLAGESVLLVARGRRLANLQRDGLQLAAGETVMRVEVPTAAAAVLGGPARLVVIGTKMIDFPGALDLACPVIGPKTALLTVQNGVEAPAMAAQRFPATTILASRVHGFFEMIDNLVRHVGVEPSLELGAIGPDPGDRALEVADMFERAGIATLVSDDIASSLWSKFLLAASVGGVALAFALPAGQVSHDPEARAMLGAAMREVQEVARARGVSLPTDIVATTMAFAATFPTEATTSLERDVRSGTPSEYDYLPGAIVRLGAESDVATPSFAAIDRMAITRHQALGFSENRDSARQDEPPAAPDHDDSGWN